MEQLSQNALVEAEVQRLEAELEHGRRRLAAMEAQLAKKRERANLPSRQHTEGEYSKAVAPLPATRDESSSKDEDTDRDKPAAAAATAAIPAAATARAGVAGGVSGTRGIDAASAAAAEIPDQHQLRALCQLGLDAPQAHNADEPTPVASRAARGAGPSPTAPARTALAPSAVAKEALRLLRAQNLPLPAYTVELKEIVAGYLKAIKTGELAHCARVLHACLPHPWAYVFALPVDPIAYNLPDYNVIVQNPMDFTTIFSKLIDNMYKDGFGFKSDMELVFYNCKHYNKVTDFAYIAAADPENGVEKFFTDKATNWLAWLYLPQKSANPPRARAAPKPAQKRRRADAGGSGGAAGEAVDADEVRRAAKRTAARAAEVAAIGHAEAARRQQQLWETTQRQVVRQQRAAAAAAAARPPMTFAQKRLLNVAMANLPIARQARVVQIVAGKVEKQDDEIEIDMDQMDNATLWLLFDYVFTKRQQMEMEINHDELVVGAPSAAPAAAPPPKPAAKPAASSSDDSSSDDSSSDDEDDKPAVSKPVAGEPKPSAPAIIPNAMKRKEVTIQNASSWANFAAQGDAAAGGTAAPGGNGTAAAGEAAIPDALWSEFARKEAEKAAREAAARREKERIQQAREREEAERAAAVAKAKADAEAAETAAKVAAEAEEARRVAEREAARERARAELANVDQTVNLDEQRSLMEEMGGGGGAYGGFVMPAFPGMDEPAITITDEPAPVITSTNKPPRVPYGTWHDVE